MRYLEAAMALSRVSLVSAAIVSGLVSGRAASQTAPGRVTAPIIDVHLHAFGAGTMGRKPPVVTCAGQLTFSPRDPKDAYSFEQYADCRAPLQSALTDSALLAGTLAMLTKYNITAVTGGVDMRTLRRWKDAAGARIIPAIGGGSRLNVDSIRRWAADGSISVLAELTFQYEGLAPGDSIPERLFGLAEELDLPVGIHVGLGAPGAPYGSAPSYRMRLSNALTFEDVLVRHPKLRIYLMHAGWPFVDEAIALLYAHPQVYVDVALIDWYLPRAEFYTFLKRLVEAGFEKRIMFGSDQVVWPQVIPIAIESIERAPFLTPLQKRDILYNNAVRFFRLNPGKANR